LWSTCVDSLITNGIDALTTVPLANGSEVYILLGTCYSEYNNYEAVTCISESGVLLWNHLYDPWLGTLRVCTTTDSCALLVGYTGFGSSGGTGVYLLKLKPDGTVVYSKAVGPFDFSWPHVNCEADKILLTGYITVPQGQLFTICMDTALNFIWQRKIYGSNANMIYTVHDQPVLCSDGGYALITDRQTAPNGTYSLCLIKGDQTGSALCTEQTTNHSVTDRPCTWITDHYQYPLPVSATPQTVTSSPYDVNNTAICSSVDVPEVIVPVATIIGPNPSGNTITIRLKNNSQPKNEAVLYNILGEEVARNDVHGSEFQLNVSGLPAGTYSLAINGMTCTDRIVVIR
jgi:hypothetical protein